MAIIRSRRLFATNITPGGLETLAGPGDPRYTSVYTCPAGYRTIFRTISATLTSTPPSGQEPIYAVNLMPHGVLVHWYWFVEHWGSVSQWRLSDTWNAMLVLHSGDALSIANASTSYLSVQGSGHLLPE